MISASICFLFLPVASVFAATSASVEFARVRQEINDARIPGEGGTKISLADVNPGPFKALRFDLRYRWNERHGLGLLVAPLELSYRGALSQNSRFASEIFTKETPTEFVYRFDSYRLTYAYHLTPGPRWSWAVGFTGKIRDAAIEISQGTSRAVKSNTGFVPLLNLQGAYTLSESWRARLDFDGLAAPQGRAVDLALLVERKIGDRARVYGGYRTIEGGADNSEVYNFAWFHFLSLGLTLEMTPPPSVR